MAKSNSSPIVPFFNLSEPTNMSTIFMYNSYDPSEGVNENPSMLSQQDGGTVYNNALTKFNDANFPPDLIAKFESDMQAIFPKYIKVSWAYDAIDSVIFSNEGPPSLNGLGINEILLKAGCSRTARELYNTNKNNVISEDSFPLGGYLGFKTINSGLTGQLKMVVSSSLTNINEATEAFIETTIKNFAFVKGLIEGTPVLKTDGTNIQNGVMTFPDYKKELEILSNLYGTGGDEFDSTLLAEILSIIHEQTTEFLDTGLETMTLENKLRLSEMEQSLDSSFAMTCKIQLFGAMITAASQDRFGVHGQQYQSPISPSTSVPFSILASTISNQAQSMDVINDANFELSPPPLIDSLTAQPLALDWIKQTQGPGGYIAPDLFSVLFGFLIDRYRVYPDGRRELTADSPIFVDRDARNFIDVHVRYGQTYLYNISSLYFSKVPVYNVKDEKYTDVFLLLKSSNDAYSLQSAVHTLPPPPPTSISVFLSESIDGFSLTLTWHPPSTPQDYIKGFQVFRRSHINDPFELQRQIMFNDSIVKFSTNETISKHLVEKPVDRHSNPMYRNFYVDDNFDINESYIYAIAAIDAHGLLSNYSEQIKVSFDARKRVIQKELVSIQGAPRQMPNYFIKNKFAGLSMGDSNSKSMKIYLDPDYLRLKSDDAKVDMFPPGAVYKLQLLNLDLQQVQNLNIVINNTISNELMNTL